MGVDVGVSWGSARRGGQGQGQTFNLVLVTLPWGPQALGGQLGPQGTCTTTRKVSDTLPYAPFKHTPSRMRKPSSRSPAPTRPRPAPAPGLRRPHPDQPDRLRRPRREAPRPHAEPGQGVRGAAAPPADQCGTGRARAPNPGPGIPTHPPFFDLLEPQGQVRGERGAERKGQAWDRVSTDTEGEEQSRGRSCGWSLVFRFRLGDGFGQAGKETTKCISQIPGTRGWGAQDWSHRGRQVWKGG